MTSVVILSPHIDDAVFSCWHLLIRPKTAVVTVFAGSPAKGTTTLWDRLCGEPDSVVMMQKRSRENETILREIGVPIYNLSFTDRQYRPVKRDIEKIAHSILTQAGNDVEYFAPLAGSKLWNHPDHITLRNVGKFLLNQGKKVSFYADIPYMQMPSRPSTGFKNRMSHRVAQLVDNNFSVEQSELSVRDQVRKRSAMRQFESQYKMTNLVSLGTLGRRANIQREVIFRRNVTSK